MPTTDNNKNNENCAYDFDIDESVNDNCKSYENILEHI